VLSNSEIPEFPLNPGLVSSELPDWHPVERKAVRKRQKIARKPSLFLSPFILAPSFFSCWLKPDKNTFPFSELFIIFIYKI